MRTILTEDKAKKILRKYNIPVPHEALASDEEEAVRIAREVGYPLLLKPVLSNLEKQHDIFEANSEEDVRIAYKHIAGRKTNLEGVLVQKKIPSGREVVVSFVKGTQFGHVVFSLGGIFSDILKDTAFRTAPVSKEEALKMMKEIKFYSILEKGEAPSDLEAVADIIAKVSRIGVENSRIVEMNINPLFVYDRGAVAVGASMILKKEVKVW